MQTKWTRDIALGAGVTSLACVLQLVSWSMWKPFAFLFFYPAVFVAGAFAGRRGGGVATVLSIFYIEFLFLEPRFSLGLEDTRRIGPLLVFALVGAAAAEVGQRLRDRTNALARERERTEDRERLLRAFTNALPGMTAHWRADLTNTFANRAYETWFGRSPEELEGTSIRDLLGPELFAKNEPFMRRALAGENVTFERTLVTPAGETRHSLATYLPSKRDGKVDGFFVLVTDVTELRTREEELRHLRDHLEAEVARRTAELTRSNQELAQFAHVAAHDLKEPLRMVASYVGLLERKYKGRLDDQADRYIAYAVTGATRMQALIRDVLLYAGVDRGDRPLTDVSLSSVVERVRENLAVALTESDATLEVSPLPSVHGDETQLALLFQNLITNAVKFRGEKAPHVTIGVGETEDASLCHIVVSDRGAGFDMAHAGRLFEMFQRVDPQRSAEGTGIGLAIAKKVVESHGGKIWAESKPGEGARFHFTLRSAMNREKEKLT